MWIELILREESFYCHQGKKAVLLMLCNKEQIIKAVAELALKTEGCHNI